MREEQKEELINNYPLSKAIELKELRKENRKLKDLINSESLIKVKESIFEYKTFSETQRHEAYNELIISYNTLKLDNMRLLDELNAVKRRVESHNKKLFSRKIDI